ncbi:hypothetical protein PIB30_058701 [Stylosanthes scabra]|uniref:Uncharacterized protein n=1 Tax=Stylosanthes scabra TaxID=79078 RepID=A0ABU6YIW1_9FABA|nr:hypothetical protein [Stylosanthes scabra]
MDSLKQHRPRKLNLNAPLLSTRRYYGFSSPSSNSLSAGAVLQNDHGVPFSWEQAPGKPKSNHKSDYSASAEAESDTPRLTLPPPPDVGFVSGDDDEDDEDYSDAMDVFSLSEALDIVQKKSERKNSGGGGGGKNNSTNNNESLLRLKIQESNGYQSPTYMINRFLPDATALAASSALHFPSNCDEKGCETCSYQECCLSSSARSSSAVRNNNGYNENHDQTYSYSLSSRSCYCGLEVLFPWRVKHKLCSMKSPVLMPPINNVKKKKAEEHNQRGGAKQKKHRRRSSSSTLSHLPWSCTSNSKEDSI